MKDRRKRLLKIQFKNNGNLKNFTSEFTALLRRKQEVLSRFDTSKLESLLKESTKSTALELVQTLLPSISEHGILSDIEVCNNIKIDPQSPNYLKKTKTNDFSGGLVANTIVLTEESLTIDNDSDGDKSKSNLTPVQAYSDGKRTIDNN